MDIITAHKYSSNNRESIIASKKCWCFYCWNIFTTNKIIDWCDENENKIWQTPLCPKCWIDSIIWDKDVNFDKWFLIKMKKYWF